MSRRYERAYNRGYSNNRNGGNNARRDHTARDAWYAIIACLGCLGFGAFWVGLGIGNLVVSLVGGAFTFVLLATMIASFVRSVVLQSYNN